MPPPSVSICWNTEMSRSSPPLSHWSTTLATVLACVALFVTWSRNHYCRLRCECARRRHKRERQTHTDTETVRQRKKIARMHVHAFAPGGSGHMRPGHDHRQGRRTPSTRSAAATPAACPRPTSRRTCSPSACPSLCSLGCTGCTSPARRLPPVPSRHQKRPGRTWLTTPRGRRVTPLKQPSYCALSLWFFTTVL